jgi:hypothetical protein
MRIATNIAVHWTSLFLTTGEPARIDMSSVAPSDAQLRFRGFSRVRIHPKREEPELFFYPDPQPVSMWNPTPGIYTRYGDVGELTTRVDDRMVIMGSGDELALEFEESAFPPVRPGFTRSFLLAVDGWAKDRDPNTAWSQSVEPLPFHGMSRYPYTATERFPDTAAHRAWRQQYNTRPALRPLRPLAVSRNQ